MQQGRIALCLAVRGVIHNIPDDVQGHRTGDDVTPMPSPEGLRPQARVGAQPPKAALSA
mgnify:CR=1 FL=1